MQCPKNLECLALVIETLEGFTSNGVAKSIGLLCDCFKTSVKKRKLYIFSFQLVELVVGPPASRAIA